MSELGHSVVSLFQSCGESMTLLLWLLRTFKMRNNDGKSHKHVASPSTCLLNRKNKHCHLLDVQKTPSAVSGVDTWMAMFVFNFDVLCFIMCCQILTHIAGWKQLSSCNSKQYSNKTLWRCLGCWDLCCK